MNLSKKIRLLLFPILSLSLLWGCEEKKVRREIIRPVRAMRIGDAKELERRPRPGRAKATQEVNLSFRVSGPLVSLPVNVGDEVKKGQVLARIDPNDFEVRLRNAEGQLARARAEFQALKAGARPEELRQLRAAVRKAEAAFRIASLEHKRFLKALETNAVSKNVVDQKREAKNQADEELRRAKEELQIGQKGARKEDIAAKRAEIMSLRANVQTAKDDLRYSSLRAPFDGKVAAKFVENFQDVRAKQPVVRLVDNSEIEFVVDIPENLIGLAKYVTTAWVRFDAFPKHEIPAKIKEVGTEANQTTRTYPVTLIMTPPEGVEILPGMAGVAWGDVKLPENLERQGYVIPISSVFSKDGKSFVWIIDEKEKKASKKEIKVLGDLSSQGIRVAGLKAGVCIATAGVNLLREGQKVRLQKYSKPIPKKSSNRSPK
jgi:RND family efflux transporter MFP subunit